MMNGEEIFNLLYDGKIKQDECIEVIHDEEEGNHFILRYKYGNNNYGDFDEYELISCLLFKEYKFKIIKQDEAHRRLEQQKKQEEIERLEKRLKELKNKEVK